MQSPWSGDGHLAPPPEESGSSSSTDGPVFAPAASKPSTAYGPDGAPLTGVYIDVRGRVYSADSYGRIIRKPVW
eukprot:10146970-Lingulodinium_polyedra.AAC.1